MVRDAERKGWPQNGGGAGSKGGGASRREAAGRRGTGREEESKAMFGIQHYREILFEGHRQGIPGKGQKVTPMILGIWGHRVKVAVPSCLETQTLLGAFSFVA